MHNLAVQFSRRAVDAAAAVNPMRVAEEHYFGQHGAQNYRKQAIEHCCRVPFWFRSTDNVLGELMGQLVTMHCPYCKCKMKYQGAGGASSMGHSFYSPTWRCQCGGVVTLTMLADSLLAKPPEAEPDGAGV